MISFKTNELKGRKKVLIDGHGYTVRRMGNIEQMEYSQSVRKLQKLAELEATRSLTEEEKEQVDTIALNLSKVFISLFDDGGNQTKSKKLVSSLTEDEISELLLAIFAEPTAEKAEEDVTAKA